MRTPLIAFLLLSLTVSAPAVVITGQSVFDSNPGGVFGDWTHSYNVGAAGVLVSQIKITLNSSLFFDTTLGGPGFALAQDVSTSNAGGTGFSGFSSSGAGLDGGIMVILSFGNFTLGKTYQHTGDVDENVTLQNCSGLAPVQFAQCLAANAAASIDGSLTTGAEFAGSRVDVTLTGPALASPVVLTGIFAATGANSAAATWTGDVTLIPEPGTWLLAGGSLVGLGLLRRRWSSL